MTEDEKQRERAIGAIGACLGNIGSNLQLLTGGLEHLGHSALATPRWAGEAVEWVENVASVLNGKGE